MARHPAARTRRQFVQGSLTLAGLALLSGCSSLTAQTPQPSRAFRVGLLAPYSLDPSPEGTAFRQGLHDLGLVEGKNLAIDARYSSTVESLQAAVRDLLSRGVEVIVTIGSEATKATRELTGTVPIVMLLSANPVGEGLITSLARPGGNVTGLTNLGAGLGGKRLDYLRTAVPQISRVAVIWNTHQDAGPALHEIKGAAEVLRVSLEEHPVDKPGALEAAFSAIVRNRVGGVMLLHDQVSELWFQKPTIALATEHRLPTIAEVRSFAHQGGLLAFGPNIPDLYRRGAFYVDRILKGAKPADLPVEQPTKFDFVINLQTAQALGLTISQSLLQQSTEVIQ